MEKNRHALHHHGGHHPGAHGDDDRHGARQRERFNPARAALLDDRSRFEYLPPDEIFNMLHRARWRPCGGFRRGHRDLRGRASRDRGPTWR